MTKEQAIRARNLITEEQANLMACSSFSFYFKPCYHKIDRQVHQKVPYQETHHINVNSTQYSTYELVGVAFSLYFFIFIYLLIISAETELWASCMLRMYS